MSSSFDALTKKVESRFTWLSKGRKRKQATRKPSKGKEVGVESCLDEVKQNKNSKRDASDREGEKG